MAIQNNTTVKGAVINNAYIKIQRLNLQASPKPAVAAKPATAAILAANGKPAVAAQPPTAAAPAGTTWNGNVVVGIYANKALADAAQSNAIDSQVIQIVNALTLPTGANVVASIYTYLLTLPQFAGSTSV